MSKQSNGLLITGVVLLGVLLAGLAYVFLISPELDKANVAREDTELARSENELLELQIQRMQALEQEVPSWREAIAKISLDLPPRIEQADFIRLLTEEMESAELPLVDAVYGRPTEVDSLSLTDFEPPTLAGDDEDEAEGAEPQPSPSPTASTGTETDGSAGTTTPTPAEEEALFEGLYGIPVTVTTEGSPEAILGLLESMNGQLDRFFTLTNLNVSTATISEEAPERPELTEEDWTIQFTGLIFTLIDDERSWVIDEEGPLPPFSSGDGVDNGFAPLDGLEDDSAA